MKVVDLYPNGEAYDDKLKGAFDELKDEGGCVFFHLGTYLFTHEIVVPKNVNIKGEGSDLVGLDFNMQEGEYIVHFLCEGGNVISDIKSDVVGTHRDIFKCKGDLTIENVDVIANPFFKRNGRMNYSGADMEKSTVINHSEGKLTVKNCYFFAPSKGIKSDNAKEVTVDGAHIYTSGHSVEVTNSEDIKIKNIRVRGKNNKDFEGSNGLVNVAVPTLYFEKCKGVKATDIMVEDVFGDDAAIGIIGCKDVSVDSVRTYNVRETVLEKESENVLISNILYARGGKINSNGAKISNVREIEDKKEYDTLFRKEIF